MSIRGESIKYGARKKKAIDIIDTEMIQLEQRIKELETQLGNITNANGKLYDEIQLHKTSLGNIIRQKTQGAIIRLRIQCYEEGESNSKYFFNLEKRTTNIKSINRLDLSDGSITEDPDIILQEMKKYKKCFILQQGITPQTFLTTYWAPKQNQRNILTKWRKNLRRESYLTSSNFSQIIKLQERTVYLPNFTR